MGVVYYLYDHSRKECFCIGKRVSDVFREEIEEWTDCGGLDWTGAKHLCRAIRRYATVEQNLRRIAQGAFDFMRGRERVCMHDDCSYDEPDGYVEVGQ